MQRRSGRTATAGTSAEEQPTDDPNTADSSEEDQPTGEPAAGKSVKTKIGSRSRARSVKQLRELQQQTTLSIIQRMEVEKFLQNRARKFILWVTLAGNQFS